MTHLAVVTTEVLPSFKSPCAGGGVRIWGLAEHLRKQGIQCTFLIEESAASSLEPSFDRSVHFFKPDLLPNKIQELNCDVILVEQWQPLTFLSASLEIPIIVDLPGPLLLEYFWRDKINFNQHIADKVQCLARADYFLCAHERQRGYYTAWLTWAGIDPGAERLKIVPFSLHEMPRSRQGFTEDEPQFFWGGMFWPWQERAAVFDSVLKTLAHYRKGQLVIVGATGSDYQTSVSYVKEHADHPYVSWLGALPFSEYIAELKRAAVAIDISKPTEERRLSSDLRTGTALWAGTPCLVAPESCWADWVETHNAGWVLAYGEEDKLINLIKDIALGRVDIVAKRRGALEISQRISNEENISELISILDNPVKREYRAPFFESRFEDREIRLKQIREELNQLKHENASLRHDLDSIRSKFLFRLYKRISSFRKR